MFLIESINIVDDLGTLVANSRCMGSQMTASEVKMRPGRAILGVSGCPAREFYVSYLVGERVRAGA